MKKSSRAITEAHPASAEEMLGPSLVIVGVLWRSCMQISVDNLTEFEGMSTEAMQMPMWGPPIGLGRAG